MISDLKKESADEVKHKDYCNTEFHNNEMETLEVEDTIKDLTTVINDQGSAMGTLKDEIAALQAAIADTQLNVQRANENRAKESKQLQAKRHRQEPGAAAPPPPAGFSDYKSNSGSGS